MSKKLAFISPDINLNGSIAIIGSSNNLLNNNYGGIINAYDNVIRFNRSITSRKYSKHVGTKTTLRAVNNHVFDNVDISSQGYTNSPKNFVKNLRKQNILYIGPHDGPWDRREKNVHRSNNLYKFEYLNIEKLKKSIGIETETNLQIGTIIVALCVFSELTPHLFGFDLKNIERTHYFQQRPPTEDSINHSPKKEKEALKKLAKNKRITIHE